MRELAYVAGKFFGITLCLVIMMGLAVYNFVDYVITETVEA